MGDVTKQTAPSTRIRSFFIKDILEHKNGASTEISGSPDPGCSSTYPDQESHTEPVQKYSVQHILSSTRQRTAEQADTCIAGCCECSSSYQYNTVNTPFYHPYLYSVYRQQAAWRNTLKGGVAYFDPQTVIYSGGKQRRARRPWTRAVFSNLQRKGLEKRFQVQKYLTKGDRHQLASMLGLSDNQVKVWFQNRRMKWRQEEQVPQETSSTADKTTPDIQNSKASPQNTDGKTK